MTAPSHRSWLSVSTQGPQLVEIDSGLVVVDTSACPGHDQGANEDALGLIDLGPFGVVLVVADGLGGHENGAPAAATVIETMHEFIDAMPAAVADLQARILAALERANERILERYRGAATTATVATICERRIRTYHVGDSGVLVCSQRGRIKLRSVGHGPVGYAVGAGIVDPADVLDQVDHHLVSNVVGMPAMTIDVGTGFELASRDTVLLASDGLLDNLSDARIADTIRSGPLLESAQQLAAELVTQMTRDAGQGKPDDHAFVLYRPASS